MKTYRLSLCLNLSLCLSLSLSLCLFPSLPLAAQGFSGGFRAGLNFNTFEGDQEVVEDMTVENFNRTTGFHVGATFAYAFTDLVGVKAELMYSQKGAEVLYDGPSYFYLFDSQGNGGQASDRIVGNLSSERDVVNSYIDIPLMAYYRIGPVEIEGGVSGGFLVNSRASGGGTYTDNSFQVSNINIPDEIVFNYDYDYFRDDIGAGSIIDPSGQTLSTGVSIPSVIGAYYNSNNDRPLYRRLDFAVIGGVAVFLNNGLFIGARYQLGLTDVTRGENDRRRSLSANDVTEREYNSNDKDYNRVIQASIGFRF